MHRGYRTDKNTESISNVGNNSSRTYTLSFLGLGMKDDRAHNIIEVCKRRRTDGECLRWDNLCNGNQGPFNKRSPEKLLSPQYAINHGNVNKNLQYRVLGQWFNALKCTEDIEPTVQTKYLYSRIDHQ